MDVGFTPPKWTVIETLRDSRVKWSQDFENSYDRFAEKITEFIALEIFAKLKESLSDQFRLQPSENRTFKRDYHLDILNSKNALKLREMAQEVSNEAPFNEWFARFIELEKKEEKIVEDKEDLVECSSSLFSIDKNSSGSRKIRALTRTQDSNIAIDGSYFADRMAIIGKRVCENLNGIFSKFTKNPENQCLNITATWLGDHSTLSASEFALDIQVEFWLKAKKAPQQNLQLASEKLVAIQTESRKKKHRVQMTVQFIACLALILFFGTLIFNKEKKQNQP